MNHANTIFSTPAQIRNMSNAPNTSVISPDIQTIIVYTASVRIYIIIVHYTMPQNMLSTELYIPATS